MNKTVLVAPMMDCTDRHDRYFLRLISKNVKLYTEIIVAKAIIKGDRDFHLKFNLLEKPLVLQIGGSDPKELAQATKIGENYGYNEINLQADKVCLAIDFTDGNHQNWLLENIRLLCPNCYLSFNGMFEKSKRFCR